MPNTSKDRPSHDATADSVVFHVSKRTIAFSAMLIPWLIAVYAATLHGQRLQGARAAKVKDQCMMTLEVEVPSMRRQIQDLMDSHLRIRQAHHQAVGVLDGEAYYDKADD